MVRFSQWGLLIAWLTVGSQLASISFAQSSPYSAPGSVQGIRDNPRELLDSAIDNSRWKFGRLRVDPWIGIDRLGYVSNTVGQLTDSGEDKDFLAVASAGFQGYLPVGSKAFLTLHARPEYNWWSGQDQRSGLNEVYGASLFGLYNRLQTEVSLGIREHLGVVTRELEQELVQREEAAKVDFSVNLYRHIDLVAGTSVTQFESVDRSVEVQSRFQDLDREETVSRFGLRINTDRVSFTAGIQDSEAQFSQLGRDRSNSSTSLFVSSTLQGSRSWLSLDWVGLDIQPDQGAVAIAPISDNTGRVEVGMTSRSQKWNLAVYSRRGLVYALSNIHSHFIAQSTGTRLQLSSSRSTLSGYYETGTDRYQGLTPRNDDRTAYGIDYQLPLGDRSTFGAGYSHSEVDQGAGVEFDRNVDRFRLGVTFTPFGAKASPPSIRASGI